MRDDLIDALLSIPTGTVQTGRLLAPGNRVNGLRWSAASTADKNNWLINNYDRVVFGSVIANHYTVATGAMATFANAALAVRLHRRQDDGGGWLADEEPRRSRPASIRPTPASTTAGRRSIRSSSRRPIRNGSCACWARVRCVI